MREALDRLGDRVAAWERRIAAGEDLPLAGAVDDAIAIAAALIAVRVPEAVSEPHVLEAFRLLARADPSWNAVRDNLRELVYYRNCLAAGREDALPPAAAKMAVRTARHLHLYFSTRCEQERRR